MLVFRAPGIGLIIDLGADFCFFLCLAGEFPLWILEECNGCELSDRKISVDLKRVAFWDAK